MASVAPSLSSHRTVGVVHKVSKLVSETVIVYVYLSCSCVASRGGKRNGFFVVCAVREWVCELRVSRALTFSASALLSDGVLRCRHNGGRHNGSVN
jgi:hypothetical protein